MSLFTPLLWIVLIAPLIVIAHLKTEKSNLKYLVFFILYFFADVFLQASGKQLIDLDLKFNWAGKILSLILGLIIIFSVSKEERIKIGFTSETNSKNNLKFGLMVFFGFTFFDIIFKLILFPKGGNFDLETFLFQATMPGLTEEILFRGISLWLLEKAFAPTRKYHGVKFGWAFIIVTVLFGVSHGAVLDQDLHLKFDLITMVYLTVISSFSVGILRNFSGNLIYSILGHNTINLINAVIRIL
ncbi:CPBP family intramembrane glutamic endopeptidase [Flavobacterium ginsenosidimutans]|uniref:CPBP family intramembrane glutamic endopeptidase n=1 Tax=Flavobacterium ginsenosidimutans TaxID=687844 RepID=A0ABZ2Q198_9FLAO|nr:CPBP family intramembrane glutamic endopeptidase [Flavobacterium ginsenosidimutans]KAF2326426.1 CPBP family intramembrane metalloprotease [Flavobacterium ginsenosidimutans]